VERLWINPDCGLARLPRHLAFAKLKALVAGTRQVRCELTGAPSTSLRPPSVAPGTSSDT
jgi:5-methyltetrahydropteroyltriglutamate--homocysteine methyltransferase